MIQRLFQRLRQGRRSRYHSAELRHSSDVVNWHQQLARQFIRGHLSPPEFPLARGVVICGGGKRLFPSAWVCLRMLRHLGCRLPIQLWHLGDFEVDRAMTALVAPFDVETVDARAMTAIRAARILNGWELKAFAILHSPFREVVLLDADNLPLHDVESLFSEPAFAKHGAIFWPDYGRFAPSRPAWHVFEVPYRDEPEFESGQIVVDKQRCYAPLQLAMHYNEYSDFYYHYVHGDKDTFRMAFHRLGHSFAMPSTPIHPLDATMCQHNFAGQRLFQHRNMDKWRLDGGNRTIEGFQEEGLCRQFLAELRSQWCGQVLWNDLPCEAEQQTIDALSGRRCTYERIGYDRRNLELCGDRTIGEGAAAMERRWTVHYEQDQPSVVIHGDDGPTCRLREEDGVWRGKWFRHERMPVILRPDEG